MGVDEKLGRRAAFERRAFFRWYRWRGPTLSFGYSQRRLMEGFKTDLPKVLRPTGGGVLLHGWDLSFTLAVPKEPFGGPLRLYRFTAETFVETFKRLGVGVTYSRRKVGNYRGGPCLLYPTFGEVLWRGKKVVAAAAREFPGGGLLLHGSLFLAKKPKVVKRTFGPAAGAILNSFATLNELGLSVPTVVQTFEKLLREKLAALLR